MRAALLAALLVASPTTHALTVLRAQTPSISPDGSTLAFSFQNDVWTVPTTGGQASRITVHLAPDTNPRWSADGKRIIFSSNRYGSVDIFSITKEGNDLKRLSFESATEYLYSVSPDGRLILGYSNAWGRANLFCLPSTGGEVARMTGHPLEMQCFPSVSPDGNKIVYCLGGSGGNWRNPSKRGTDTAEIVVGSIGLPVTDNKRITKNDANDIFPHWGPDNKIYFFSNRSGSPQLWVMDPDGSDAKQLTQHDGGTCRWSNLSASGKLAYEYDGRITVYDIKSKKLSTPEITVGDDKVLNPTLDITLNSGADGFAPSPDGKRAIVSARGDLFLIPASGGTTRRLTSSPAKDFAPLWLDAKKALFVSGRSAKRELYTVDIEGNEKLFASDTLDLTNPGLSPDGKWVACHRGYREIVLIPAIGGTAKVIAEGSFPGTFQFRGSFAWSPDSKWLAWTDDTERGTNVWLTQIETGKKVLAARIAKGADGVQFMPNGKSLFFSSNGYSDSDIEVVDLQEPELTFTEDDLDSIDQEKPKPPTMVDVKVDERNLLKRKRRITNGDTTPIIAGPDGRSIWAIQNGVLVSIPLSGGPAQPVPGVTGPMFNIIAGPGGKLYGIQQGRIVVLGGQAPVPVNFSAQISVNRAAEDLELFKEIWWAMSRMYYDPGMHGKNWQRIQDEYMAKVPNVADRQDFYALMTEMIEELDSSHLGITPAPAETTVPGPNEQTAFIGVEWDWFGVIGGQYKVASVLRGSPADLSASLLKKDDIVVSVNGKALSIYNTWAESMKNQVGKKVRLTIEREGKTLDILIKPSSPAAATGLRYEQFIEDRRAEAERLSGGKITYYHIQGMNTPSTDRFMSDNRVYGEGKSAAVVDVRWNGGGNTANRILAMLRADKWLLRRFKSMPGLKPSEEMFRGEAIEMPVALMTNQYSASNAEIFSEGFRRMKLGPIVGEATGGNVLTVSGDYGLWDGGGVQIPFIGVDTLEGEPLEGEGRRVDFDVRYDPNAWNEGRDNQLEVAIRELLKRTK